MHGIGLYTVCVCGRGGEAVCAPSCRWPLRLETVCHTSIHHWYHHELRCAIAVLLCRCPWPCHTAQYITTHVALADDDLGAGLRADLGPRLGGRLDVLQAQRLAGARVLERPKVADVAALAGAAWGEEGR